MKLNTGDRAKLCWYFLYSPVSYFYVLIQCYFMWNYLCVPEFPISQGILFRQLFPLGKQSVPQWRRVSMTIRSFLTMLKKYSTRQLHKIGRQGQLLRIPIQVQSEHQVGLRTFFTHGLRYLRKYPKHTQSSMLCYSRVQHHGQ